MLPRAREQATYSLLRDDGGSAASLLLDEAHPVVGPHHDADVLKVVESFTAPPVH